jgi:GAF domain-containing protein
MDGELPAQMGTNLGPHWRAALAGEVCTVEGASADGQRDYWLHFAPLRPHDGELVGVILVAQDVTARLRGALGAELLDAAARAVHAALGEDLVLVLEHSPAGGVIVRAEAGELASDLPDVRTAGVRRSIGVLRAIREPVLSHDLAAEPRFETPTLEAAGMLSLVAAPIGEGNDAFGTLLACSRRRGAFSEDDLGFLQSVAEMLMAAANLS